jgi:hypothetical protein
VRETNSKWGEITWFRRKTERTLGSPPKGKETSQTGKNDSLRPKVEAKISIKNILSNERNRNLEETV